MKLPFLTRKPVTVADVPPEVRAEIAAVAAKSAKEEERAQLQRMMLEALTALQQPGSQPPYKAFAFDHPIRYSTPLSPKRKPDSVIDVYTLRQFSRRYDVARACIKHLKRETRAIPIKVVPRNRKDDSQATAKRIDEAEYFFSRHGGLGGCGRHRREFESLTLEDVLVVGASAVFFQLSKGGQMLEAVHIDAATIRPRVDAWGWPGPQDNHYEQWIEGRIVRGFTPEELSYEGIEPMPESPYYLSAIELLLSPILSAMKADQWNQNWLTNGNTPSDMLALPEGWAPEQIQAYWTMFNDMLSDPLNRAKIIAVPGGSQRVGNPTRKDQDFQQFELWLLRRCCAIFGVQPASIGFAGEQYKVSQEGSMRSTTQFGAGELLEFRKDMYDDFLDRLGFQDLEVVNVVDDEEDAKTAADRRMIQTGTPVKTINEARAEDGLEPVDGGDVLLVPQSLVPLERAIAEPEPEEKPGTSDEPDDEEQQRVELARWERKCLNRVREGKLPQCQFESDFIPDPLGGAIYTALAECRSDADVAELFRAFNPNQPRDSKGRWVSTGAHVSSLHAEHGGSTWHVKHGDLVGKKLWAVSPFTEASKHFDGKEIPAERIDALVKQHQGLLAGEKVAVGTWYDPKQNKSFLDITLVLKSKKQAIMVAKQYDQIGIYGLEKGEYVETGGSGRHQSFDVPFEERVPK